MSESCAILQYLAARYGGDLHVRPEDADFPAYLDFLHYGEASLTFPQGLYARLTKAEPQLGAAHVGEMYRDMALSRLLKLDLRLAERDHLCGRFTAADIAVGYGLHVSRLLGLDAAFPARIAAYAERILSRPAFARAVARQTG